MKIKLTESQLKEIIERAVRNCIKESGEGIECCQVTKQIPIKKRKKGFGDTEYIKSRIREGLIKTYPVDKTINIISKRFNLEQHQIQKETIEEDGDIVTLLIILLPINISRNKIGEIINGMKACGYYVSEKFRQDEDDASLGYIVFEPIFQNDISSNIRESCKYLYHMTPSIYVDKILKNGLVPRSKNSIYSYPDRIYFMKGDDLTQEQCMVLKNIQDARFYATPFGNPKEKYEYSLVIVDVSQIPENVKMFTDTASNDAIFTYDNIPTTAIKDIVDFNL